MSKCGTTTSYRNGCRCAACKRANTDAQRAYMARKRDAVNEQRRRARAVDPDRYRAVEKAWRDANVDAVRDRARAEYARNRDRYAVGNQRRSRERARRWSEAKRVLLAHRGGQCVDCGHADPRALTFDHIDPATKAGAIGALVRRHGIDHPDVWSEVAKCVVRCANCHMVKTFADGDYFAGKRREHA